MPRGVAIARWLHAVNRQMRGAAIKVAVQLSQYTNRATYENSADHAAGLAGRDDRVRACRGRSGICDALYFPDGF